MNQNELITGWIYRKGELAQQRLADKTLTIAVTVSIVLSLIVAWPVMSFGSGALNGKIGGWILFLIFIAIALIVNFTCKLFSNGMFGIYKMIVGIKEEEIIFTNYKISSTSKTWILNDELNFLRSVELKTAGKMKLLHFKCVEQKKDRAASNYSIDIPVPEAEMVNAEKVCSYFKSQLGAQS